MSSSLDGRRVVVTTPVPGADVGEVFWVLGNALAVAEARIYFLGTSSGHLGPDRSGGTQRNGVPRTHWSDEAKAEARRLYAEGGKSWSDIALAVCGSRDRKSTVQLWLKAKTSVVGNGDNLR